MGLVWINVLESLTSLHWIDTSKHCSTSNNNVILSYIQILAGKLEDILSKYFAICTSNLSNCCVHITPNDDNDKDNNNDTDNSSLNTISRWCLDFLSLILAKNGVL